jgi:hypothetical protein
MYIAIFTCSARSRFPNPVFCLTQNGVRINSPIRRGEVAKTREVPLRIMEETSGIVAGVSLETAQSVKAK